MKKYAPIYIRVADDNEYDRLLNTLDALHYYWLSGHRAGDPPTFLRLIKKNNTGVRVIVVNPEKQTIAFYPIEVLSEAERGQTLLRCLSVEQTISTLERIHGIDLSNVPTSSVFDGESASYKWFKSALTALINNRFGIDIVQLVDTEDKDLLYIKKHAHDGNGDNVICKNMPQLYQQYLNNKMTIQQFADYVGVHYQKALKVKDAVQAQDDLLERSFEYETGEPELEC